MAKNKRGVNNLEQTTEADDLVTNMVDTSVGPRNKNKKKNKQ